jgi:hypothetical protein
MEINPHYKLDLEIWVIAFGDMEMSSQDQKIAELKIIRNTDHFDHH